jgi:hypothetical protein
MAIEISREKLNIDEREWRMAGVEVWLPQAELNSPRLVFCVPQFPQNIFPPNVV